MMLLIRCNNATRAIKIVSMKTNMFRKLRGCQPTCAPKGCGAYYDDSDDDITVDSTDLWINEKLNDIEKGTKDVMRVAMKEAISAYTTWNCLLTTDYSDYYYKDGDGKEKKPNVNNQEELPEEHEITIQEFMRVKRRSPSSSILKFVSKFRKPVASKRTISVSNQNSNETDNSAAKETMSFINDSNELAEEDEIAIEELMANMNDDLAEEHEAKGEESISNSHEKSDETVHLAEKEKTSIVNDWIEPVEEHELTREEFMTWSELTKEHEVTGDERLVIIKRRGVSTSFLKVKSKRRI